MHNDVLMALDPEVSGEGAGLTAAQAVAAREAAAAQAAARAAWLEGEAEDEA